ncbi:hypothetical protein FAZ15_08625 [Sphingobacterium olei]|uniref:DUF4237 domain-containing protein n=1 Tax=Sphingobacterium olei TaxID=2571155 RepID=A0A4U0P249_9SPHI|nr:hypothetical protein [Sphingobacterium olei]TJZ61253.1 hypothetical protein FAZ15_08625 [Sphingobacterium olei]
MKRNIITLLFLSLLVSGKAQVPQLEDFLHLYKPDPDGFLTGFVPQGFVKIDHIQALGVIDAFFMEKSGRNAIPGYTTPNVNYYQRGNIVMSCGVFNDSIKWHIQQDILPQEPEGLPDDPMQPVVVKPAKRYKNPYHRFDGVYMVETYLVDAFALLNLEGKLWPGMASETRTNSSLQVAYAYPTVSPMWMYPVLLAFDKDYRYKIEVRIFTVNAHRQEAVDVLKWIAEHMEISENAPI